MTASDFASMLGERRWRKGKMVRCPAHPDRSPSLSIRDGNRGVMLKCQSQGCTVKEICSAVGIRVSDLFYDKATPQVRARTSLYDQRENLERQLGLVIWLKALENGPRLNRRSDESSKQFDAVLNRWRPIGNGEPSDGR